MSPPLNHDVAQWIAHWARLRPHALAWSDAHRRCDYARAAHRIEALARWLDDQGIAAGDRVAVWLGNRGAVLETLFAATRLGAVSLPVNARLTPEEVTFQLDDSTPKVLLVESAWQERAVAACARMQHPAPLLLVVGGPEDDYEQALTRAGPHPDLPWREVGPEDPMILMYTSGTTGKPKGALLPTRKALYNSLNAERIFDLSPADRVLVAAPLFHSLGLQILALPSIFAGAGLVLQEGFNATRAWNAIAAEEITFYGGVPTMHQRLLDALAAGNPIDAPPSSLRLCFTAGAAAPPALIRALHQRGLPIIQGYGQTETSILTCLDSAHALSKAGSVGRPVPHGRLRLIDPLTIEEEISLWQDVEAGQVGEVVVSGPTTMLGYWNRAEATAETLRGVWLRTGDLATRDEEHDLTLVGRIREMYISGGENVYPAEVEATLVEHPDLAEAAVVAMPDPEWGEVGRAHVVAEKGHVADSKAILDWLQPRLARFKQPKKIVVCDALPRTASGKVQKHRLGATTPSRPHGGDRGDGGDGGNAAG